MRYLVIFMSVAIALSCNKQDNGNAASEADFSYFDKKVHNYLLLQYDSGNFREYRHRIGRQEFPVTQYWITKTEDWELLSISLSSNDTSILNIQSEGFCMAKDRKTLINAIQGSYPITFRSWKGGEDGTEVSGEVEFIDGKIITPDRKLEYLKSIEKKDTGYYLRFHDFQDRVVFLTRGKPDKSQEHGLYILKKSAQSEKILDDYIFEAGYIK